MTPAARKIADAWDPAKDEASGDQCKSYGAPAILRVPEHLHITWQDDHTLRMDTDAGKQTRIFHFGDWKAPEGPPYAAGRFGGGVGNAARGARTSRPADGSLKVDDASHLKAGYLRKNGVPYSENTSLVEYYDLVKERNGDPVDGGDDRHDRPDVSARAFYHQFTFQETGRATPDGILRSARRSGKRNKGESIMTRNKIRLSVWRCCCAWACPRWRRSICRDPGLPRITRTRWSAARVRIPTTGRDFRSTNRAGPRR